MRYSTKQAADAHAQLISKLMRYPRVISAHGHAKLIRNNCLCS